MTTLLPSIDAHYGCHELLISLTSAENGVIIPGIAVFYRMIAALGMTVEIVKPTIGGYGFTPQTKYLSDPERARYGKKK